MECRGRYSAKTPQPRYHKCSIYIHCAGWHNEGVGEHSSLGHLNVLNRLARIGLSRLIINGSDSESLKLVASVGRYCQGHCLTSKIDEWIAMARGSGQKQLMTMANTIERAKDGALAYYDCRISTGKVEGINNKIKVMKRNAYGFRDERYFTLRLYALHDCRITRNVG